MFFIPLFPFFFYLFFSHFFGNSNKINERNSFKNTFRLILIHLSVVVVYIWFFFSKFIYLFILIRNPVLNNFPFSFIIVPLRVHYFILIGNYTCVIIWIHWIQYENGSIFLWVCLRPSVSLQKHTYRDIWIFSKRANKNSFRWHC